MRLGFRRALRDRAVSPTGPGAAGAVRRRRPLGCAPCAHIPPDPCTATSCPGRHPRRSPTRRPWPASTPQVWPATARRDAAGTPRHRRDARCSDLVAPARHPGAGPRRGRLPGPRRGLPVGLHRPDGPRRGVLRGQGLPDRDDRPLAGGGGPGPGRVQWRRAGPGLRGGVPGRAASPCTATTSPTPSSRAALAAGVGRYRDRLPGGGRSARRPGRQAAAIVAEVLVRVTTGVEAHTHEFIATAHEDQKFGLSLTTGAAREAVLAVQRAPRAAPRRRCTRTSARRSSARRASRWPPTGWSASSATSPRTTASRSTELNLGGGMGIAYLSGDDPVAPVAMAEALRVDRRRRVRAARHRGAADRRRARPRDRRARAMITVYEVGTVKPVEYRTGRDAAPTSRSTAG